MPDEFPDEEETDDEADIEDDDPPQLVGEELNADLFKSAVKSLREAIPNWKMQADLLLGHSVQFVPDFNSLGGRYERIQPFVHFAITGALEAITKVRFDPTFGPGLTEVRRIIVQACPPGEERGVVTLAGPVLTIGVPLDIQQPPSEEIAGAIRAAIRSNAH
jgi:hypothetical protein